MRWYEMSQAAKQLKKDAGLLPTRERKPTINSKPKGTYKLDGIPFDSLPEEIQDKIRKRQAREEMTESINEGIQNLVEGNNPKKSFIRVSNHVKEWKGTKYDKIAKKGELQKDLILKYFKGRK